MTRHGFGLRMLFVGALVATASGCEPKFTFVPVEGTVTKNGRPLANVEVVFLADPNTDTLGPRATGRTDATGHYRMRTDRGDDGAVPGTHRVLVINLDVTNNPFSPSMRGQTKDSASASPGNAKRLEEEMKKKPAAAPRVPPKYESIPDTPLRAKVSSEPLVFDIAIP
jgi:hypothetical protein